MPLAGAMGVVELAERMRRWPELPPAELAWMQAHGRRRQLGRGEAFCEIGATVHELGYLAQGLLVVTGETSAGDVVVLDFAVPGYFISPLDAVIRGIPAQVRIAAVVPSRMVVWSDDIRRQALRRHPAWQAVEVQVLEDAYCRKHQRYLSLRTLNARERFAELVAEWPSGWRQIPQHLLAAYLAITPQYLSRLKRELEERGG